MSDKRPVECNDVDKMVVRNAYIKATGKKPAIKLRDSCSLKLIDSFVEADAVAIDARGTGGIVVEGSTVYGGQVGIKLLGSATAQVSDSTIAGKKRSLAAKATSTAKAKNTIFAGRRVVTKFAKFVDLGGNKLAKRPKRRPAAPPHK